MNFSDAMERAVNTYKSRCYLDPENEENDAFTCPICKEIISRRPIDIKEIEFSVGKDVFYRCPFCKELF